MINRRNFLRNASLLTLGGLVAGKMGVSHAASPVNMGTTAKKSIGLQIYSLGGELTKDVPAGMKKIKQIGYSTLELAGYNDGKINGMDMMEFKKIAEDNGLKITSSHVNPPTGTYTPENRQSIMEFWKKTADDHAKLGVKYLVQPGQPSTRSVEEVAYVCDTFNEAGKIMKAAGIPFGYHNHDFEFARVVPGGKEAVFNRHNKGEIIYVRTYEETISFDVWICGRNARWVFNDDHYGDDLCRGRKDRGERKGDRDERQSVCDSRAELAREKLGGPSGRVGFQHRVFRLGNKRREPRQHGCELHR